MAEETHNPTPEGSPELTKRSWFGSLMSTDKDEVYTIIVKGKALSQIKADLIHAFLSVSCPSLCGNYFGKMLHKMWIFMIPRRYEVVEPGLDGRKRHMAQNLQLLPHFGEYGIYFLPEVS